MKYRFKSVIDYEYTQPNIGVVFNYGMRYFCKNFSIPESIQAQLTHEIIVDSEEYSHAEKVALTDLAVLLESHCAKHTCIKVTMPDDFKSVDIYLRGSWRDIMEYRKLVKEAKKMAMERISLISKPN